MKYLIKRASWLTVFTGVVSTGSEVGSGGGGGGIDVNPEDESCPGSGGGGGGAAAGGIEPPWAVSLVLLFAFELFSFSNFKFLISSTEFNFLRFKSEFLK